MALQTKFPRDFQASVEDDRSDALETLRHLFGDDINLNALELIRNIARTHHLLKAAANKTIGNRISPARLSVLFQLYSQDEQGLLPSELSRIQGLAPNSMTSLLQGLREQGLIAQVSHPVDRRKQLIQITEAGKAAVQNERENCKQLLLLLEGLTPEEQQIAATLLRKLLLTLPPM